MQFEQIALLLSIRSVGFQSKHEPRKVRFVWQSHGKCQIDASLKTRNEIKKIEFPFFSGFSFAA